MCIMGQNGRTAMKPRPSCLPAAARLILKPPFFSVSVECCGDPGFESRVISTDLWCASRDAPVAFVMLWVGGVFNYMLTADPKLAPFLAFSFCD